MALRRSTLFALAALLVLGSVVPALASHGARHGRHAGSGSERLARFVRLIHTQEAIDRIALADIDNDGDLDILAARHDGTLKLWRNTGNGRFAPAVLPRGSHRMTSRGPRFVRVHRADEGSQWGDERYDAAMPRAPAAVIAIPIALVRAPIVGHLRPVFIRHSSGRAPPLA